MAKGQSDARANAESRFDKMRKTTEVAQAVVNAEQKAVRDKTERLKSLRLAKEASDEAAATGKPPKARKKKTAATP